MRMCPLVTSPDPSADLTCPPRVVQVGPRVSALGAVLLWFFLPFGAGALLSINACFTVVVIPAEVTVTESATGQALRDFSSATKRGSSAPERYLRGF
jgi:hypothetical protein